PAELPGARPAALPGRGSGGAAGVRPLRADDHRRGVRVLQAGRPGPARERRRGQGRGRGRGGRRNAARLRVGCRRFLGDSRLVSESPATPRPPSPSPDADQVVFVGSGGGRMTTALQARATGGLWIVLDGVRLHVDPGPGALVHVRSRSLGLDPTRLDAIVVTHKHLDHSGDVNAMIEAMTEGGTRPRGRVLAPRDAYEDDPVILQYVRKYAGETGVLEAGGRYPIGDVVLETPLRLRHPVETYGLRLVGRRVTVGLIACTGYFPELESAFRVDVLLLNVVFRNPRDDTHLSVPDA